jgi:geranylgeranylglycerol-phosphate geranylgeranyltransferase
MEHVPSISLLKTKLFAHFETMRPYTLFWCGLVSLTGASLMYGDFPPPRESLLVFFIPILGWIAGLYLADYFDRTLDRIQKPHRPIPSKRISPHEALFASAVFALIGLGLTFLLPVRNLILVFIVGFLVFFYAKFTKAHGLFGNYNRGAMTLVTYLFGVVSIESFSSIPMSLWILSLVFFFHDTNSNIIGAIRDRAGDKTGGYVTTPVKYGIHTTLIISVVLSTVYIILTIGVFSFSPIIRYPTYFLFLLSIGVLILMLMYLILFSAGSALTQKQSLHAHELFVTERILFASAFLVGIISLPSLSFSLCILCLILTLVSQYLLRERYELT